MSSRIIITDMPSHDVQAFDAAKARPRSIFQEIGIGSTRHSGGMVMQDFLTNLQHRRGIAVFTEMYYNDPTIGGTMFGIEQVLRQVTWDAEGVGDKDEKDKKAKQFLSENMQDMSHTWDDFICNAITFLPYGWSIFEKIYKVRRGDNQNPMLSSKFDDGKVGWRKFAFRDQRTLDSWIFDEKGNNETLAFVQRDPNSFSPLPPLPLSKSILLRTKPAGGNPEGVSILRNAYRPWFFKKRIEEIEGIGIERDLAGLPKLTPPEDFDWEDEANADALNWAKEVITHIRRDEYEGLLMPGPDWTFELVSAPGQRQFDTVDIINRWDKRIALTMLAQFMMLGMERVGSFALVKALADIWFTAIDGYVRSIEATLNQSAVRELFSLNPEFKGIELPKIKGTRINIPDLADLSKMLDVVSKNGLVDLTDVEIQNTLLRALRFPATHESTRKEPPGRIQSQPFGGPTGEGSGGNKIQKGKKQKKQKINGREIKEA